jgi:hypothetical protein
MPPWLVRRGTVSNPASVSRSLLARGRPPYIFYFFSNQGPIVITPSRRPRFKPNGDLK